LIALIPVGDGAGVLIGWAAFKGETVLLNVEGSTTVTPIVETTAQEFMKTHPGVFVTYSGTGSGTGIGTLTNGLCDVAMASRGVKPAENTTAFTQTGKYLYEHTIGKDAIAVVLHQSANPIDLEIDQIKAIFNGTYTTWGAVDSAFGVTSGLSGDIIVCVREQGSGTRDYFNDAVMGDDKQDDPDEQYVAGAEEFSGNSDVKARVAGNAKCIGYIGLGYVDATLTPVNVYNEGTATYITPSIANAQAGTYPIVRELYFVTLGTPVRGSIAWEWINYHLSPEGQSYVQDVGYIAIATRTEDLL
jgi:phosphate transport system substrate-binding protein